MAWYDYFKTFTLAFTDGPLAKKKDVRNFRGAGTTQPDVLPDLRNSDGYASGANAFIRIQNDLVDLTTTTNRVNRYKEYERLVASCPEIEMAMTVFADEACVAGDTEINTVFHGLQPISWLAQHKTTERFPVYCYDFDKDDYSIGWAYAPRLVKREKTVRICLDNGNCEVVTRDHPILTRNGQWVQAGELKVGDELMPFYRVKAAQTLKREQFPRIWTHKGWIHERQFIDEWRLGKKLENYQTLNRIVNGIVGGCNMKQVAEMTSIEPGKIKMALKKGGFSPQEIQTLARKPDRRRIIGIHPGPKTEVYDLSVEQHKNFCTKSLVMHNCQRDETGKVLKIECENDEVKDELDFLFFNRQMINLDQRNCWDKCKRLFVKGDAFWELIINLDDPKEGVYRLADLPPESMYRIETTKGKLLEFQQGKEGPDYQAIQRAPILAATESELMQATAVRFAPEQIVHIRLGDYRKTFYPYGVSLIEAARGPAHQLRMMEDSMVVYRLCVRGYDKLLTPNGTIYMKDIREGDTVWTMNRDMQLVPTKVTYHVNNGKRPVMTVKSAHGQVTSTLTHPFLVKDKLTGIVAYVDTQDLLPNRHQFIRPETPALGKPKVINRIFTEPYARLTQEQKENYKSQKFNKYKKGPKAKDKIIDCLNQCAVAVNKATVNKAQKFLATSKENISLPQPLAIKLCESFNLEPTGLIIHNAKERLPERLNLPPVVDEDFAELLGFMLGDGTLSFCHNSKKVLFASGEYPELNEKYQKRLENYFGRCVFQQDLRKAPGIGTYCVNSLTAGQILRDMGVAGDAHAKSVPNWLFSERKEIRKAFLMGLADAEGDKRGQRCKTWSTTIGMCNKKIIEDIQQLWRSIGLHASEITRIDTEERVICGTLCPPSTYWRVYISETPVPFCDDIISVEMAGEEEVYDITVDHTEHNFLVENAVLHNTRSPERRIFYVDVGTLPPYKAEAYMERLKDQFRKKKVISGRGGAGGGASAVEERWHAPAADEDYWVPMRPNSTTKIDTLPGAQNLGEIDDTVYFRNKLFVALNFPPNYFSNEDPNATRITLSAQDVKFARMIERLQSYFEDGLREVAERHLELRGFPPVSYEDLSIKMTPPSDWRELSRNEVVTNRINNANGLKGSQLMSDYDIHTKWLKYSEKESNEMLSRLKIQKLEDLKLQVLAQNPPLLGVGGPGQNEKEVGTEPGGPNPPLGPPGQEQPPQGGQPPPGGLPPMPPPPGQGMMPPAKQAKPLPDPSEEDIMRYDLDLQNFDADADAEDIDWSEVE